MQAKEEDCSYVPGTWSRFHAILSHRTSRLSIQPFKVCLRNVRAQNEQQHCDSPIPALFRSYARSSRARRLHCFCYGVCSPDAGVARRAAVQIGERGRSCRTKNLVRPRASKIGCICFSILFFQTQQEALAAACVYIYERRTTMSVVRHVCLSMQSRFNPLATTTSYASRFVRGGPLQLRILKCDRPPLGHRCRCQETDRQGKTPSRRMCQTKLSTLTPSTLASVKRHVLGKFPYVTGWKCRYNPYG